MRNPFKPKSKAPNDTLRWGPCDLEQSEATAGFFAIGAPGSGKSVILRLLLQDIVAGIRTGSNRRLLIFDAKQDTYPMLMSMKPSVPVRTTHPFDERGVGWEMGKDIREPQHAIEFAFTLVPEISESQPFWTDAVRHIVYGVLMAFLLSGDNGWGLSELIRVLRRMRTIKSLLKSSVHTSYIVEKYLSKKQVTANVDSSIATKMLRLEPIAAAWDHAKEKISLEEFATREEILILGNSETSRTATQAINRCMAKRAMDIFLGQTESFTRRSWVFIDELPEMGPLSQVVIPGMKRGRSKGVAMVAAMQSISGLRDPKLYGQHFADEVLGLVGNRFIGRLECPVTAEYVSRLFGDQEVETISTSVSHSSRENATTNTTSRSQSIRRAVLPSEFMNIAPCNKHRGLSGYYLIRDIGAFETTLDGETLFSKDLCPIDVTTTPELIPRPMEAQLLRPWTKADSDRFRFKNTPCAEDINLDDIP